MLLDMRQMLGGISKAEDVRPRWEAELAKVNRPRIERGLPLVELHDADAELQAYVNHGRWVADCECAGGIAVWPDHKYGACLDCGSVYRIRFPKRSEREKAEEVLNRRSAKHRNWFPATESLSRLKAENELLMGVIG